MRKPRTPPPKIKLKNSKKVVFFAVFSGRGLTNLSLRKCSQKVFAFFTFLHVAGVCDIKLPALLLPDPVPEDTAPYQGTVLIKTQ